MRYSESDKGNIPPVRGTDEEAALHESGELDNMYKKHIDSNKKSAEESGPNEDAEDNLEHYTKNVFQKMKNERELYKKRTKGMSGMEKLKYFLYYYKWPIVISVVIVVFIAYVISLIYDFTRPVGFSYAIVNSYDISGETNTEIISDYLKEYKLNKGYKVESLKDITLDRYSIESGNDQTATYKYMSFSGYCTNNYFDILFSNKAGMEICAENGQIHPVDQILTPDTIAKCSDRLVTAKGKDGQTVAYAIDVSDLACIKGMGLKYTDVYICFPGTSERNLTSANNFVTYILSRQ